MRAKQILQNNNEHSDTQRTRFATHFDCEMTEQDKRRFTPWLLEKCLEKVLNKKPLTIRSKTKTIFTVEVSSAEESRVMQTLSNLNGIHIKTTINTSLNIRKGLTYIYNYNLADFPEFRKELMEQYGLLDVIEPGWIRSRNTKAKPLLLTFRDEVPQYLDIPGENMKAKVYEYKDRPLLCKMCLRFGHSKKNCQETQRCAKCSELNHSVEECQSETIKCLHCNEGHQTGNYRCREYKYQEEIIAVQVKERVTRAQAKAIVDRLKPHMRDMNYAEVLQAKENDKNGLQPGAIEKEQRTISQQKKRSQNTEVDIVCVSPRSGNLYPTTVSLPSDTPGISDTENGTSETSRRLREEVKEIYRQIFEKSRNEGSNKVEVEQRQGMQERKLSKVTQEAREESMDVTTASEKRTRSQSGERTSEDNRKQKKTHINHG